MFGIRRTIDHLNEILSVNYGRKTRLEGLSLDLEFYQHKDSFEVNTSKI
jgi:hypothetical protein